MLAGYHPFLVPKVKLAGNSSSRVSEHYIARGWPSSEASNPQLQIPLGQHMPLHTHVSSVLQ